MPRAAHWLAPTAAALAFVLSSNAARATQPTDDHAGDDSAQTAAPESDAATTPSEPATTPAATAEATKPSRDTSEITPVPLAANSAADAAAPSWFARAPLSVVVGSGAEQWSVTFYGFVEADYIADTTRSYSDSMGSSLVARSDTYDGKVGRTQFSMRNTRLGMKFASPVVGGVKPSAVLEGDFFGPSSVADNTEQSFYDSPTFRIRHAYLTLQNDYVDVLAGQTYDVFGWQNYFFPCTAEFLGLPNQLFSRNMQFRLSHEFKGPVSLEIAASATRPAQRDSGVPDLDAGVRLSVDSWKGISTPGNTGTLALPMSIGVSGVARQFKVNAFTPPPTQNSNNATGWGLSVDALIPVIPASNADDRGNRLTLIGSFVTGTGISDLITANGGAIFPTLPNPTQSNPAPLYDADIDNGLVTFDTQGVLHTIDWQAFKVGIQYYLPPSGRLIFSANYTQAHSKNMAKLFPPGDDDIELLVHIADTSRYADANLFWDVTPAVRLGLSGQYTSVHYLSRVGEASETPHNIRGMAQAVYVF